MQARLFLCAALTASTVPLAGCMPGGRPVNMGMLGSDRNRSEPVVVRLPARIAVVEITSDDALEPRFRINEHPTDQQLEHVDHLAHLAGISDAFQLRSVASNVDLATSQEIRTSACESQADLILAYSLFHCTDLKRLFPLSLVTLGLFPCNVAVVDTNATAVLLDVRTGAVLDSFTVRDEADQLSNIWTSDAATHDAVSRSTRRTLEQIFGEFESRWPSIADNARRCRIETTTTDLSSFEHRNASRPPPPAGARYGTLRND